MEEIQAKSMSGVVQEELFPSVHSSGILFEVEEQRRVTHFPMAKVKATDEWQSKLWTRWPSESVWPAKLDIYEAAAYLRVSPDTIRRHLAVSRDGKARLAHQRVGSVYRIRRADLDALGSVAGTV